MLNWLLITSITLVSATLLMFVSAYIAIFEQTAKFYGTTLQKIVLLSYTFNIFYLIISPILFPWLKRHFSVIVEVATVLTAIGCVGRYLAGHNYNFALAMSVLVGIAHVPIITAPYGLLALFPPEKRGYASSIPLFVPVLGINFCILYGMNYVVGDSTTNDKTQRDANIEWLNFFIAVVGSIGAACTIIFMNAMSREIKQLNQNSEEARNVKPLFASLKDQFKLFKEFLVLCLCWATILGVNWTYGGMFGVFLKDTGLTHKEIALIGLYANLSSAVFSNLGNWISNRFHFANSTIIFYLNILGFLASVFIQASVSLPQPIFHQKNALIIAIILLRAGFASFVSLALIQLSKYGPSVLVSSIFFYIGNGTNLLFAYVVTLVDNPVSLAIMSIVVWVCIAIVYILGRKGRGLKVVEFETEDIGRKGEALESEASVEMKSIDK